MVFTVFTMRARPGQRATLLPMNVFAAATGLGSWPGVAPRQAARIVVGELHQLPHLVELPARG